MKRDKNFRMRKTTKTLLATIVDPVLRNHYKNMMIEAQSAAETPPPKKEKKVAPGVVIGGIEVDA